MEINKHLFLAGEDNPHPSLKYVFTLFRFMWLYNNANDGNRNPNKLYETPASLPEYWMTHLAISSRTESPLSDKEKLRLLPRVLSIMKLGDSRLHITNLLPQQLVVGH